MKRRRPLDVRIEALTSLGYGLERWKAVKLNSLRPVGKVLASVILALPLFAVGSFLSAASAQQVKDSEVQHLSSQDAKVLQDMRRVDLIAIAAGKTALARTRVEAVKKHAQLMVDTHSKLLEEGEKLAKFKGSRAPPEDEDTKRLAPAILDTAPADRFDRIYLGWVLEAQGDAVEVARRGTANARDPNVKALAANASARIESQLEIARELLQSLDRRTHHAPMSRLL